MSLDFSRIPASIERDAVKYAETQHITAEEAFVEIFTKGLQATKRSARAVPELTDDELAAFDQAFPALDKLADVSDEEWDRVLKSTSG